MPDKVPYSERHAHLFQNTRKNIIPRAEDFVSQRFSEIPLGRYDKVSYGIDNEELYARRQSGLDQLANGAAKMLGTFTTSFLEGTVGVINGIGAMASTQKFSSFYDNDFNRRLDEFNKYLEDALPNYYTQAEKEAEWYSPKNVFSANFLGDKVLKNLGYSFGAIAGGMGWGSLLRGVGLTNRLVRAGQGLKTVEAVENAIVNAPKAQRFGTINKTLESLWQSSKNTAGVALTNTERGIISSMGMLGEATVEAYQATNQFRDNLIENYKNLYGVPPKGADLEEINDYADSVGNVTFGANAILLTLSNYIQLPKILGSSKTLEKRMINSIEKKAAIPTDKFVAGVPTTGNILSPIFNKLGAPGKAIDKFILGPGRLAFSVGEALEEGAQYAVQAGSDDYFNRAYTNPAQTESFINGVGGALGNIFSEGVRKALSDKEGLESILIGGFSGGLQKIRGNIIERGITGTGGLYGKNTQLALDALNKTNLKEVLKDGVKYAGIAMESQQRRQLAIDNNDTLAEKDYEKDYALSYIMPRVKYGKADSIKQEIDYYREQLMTKSGFEELQAAEVVLPGETKERFLERLSEIENATKEVNQLYTMLEDKYSNMVNKDGKRMYTPDIIERLVYSAAKVNDYDKRLEGLSGKIQKEGLDTNPLTNAITETEGFKKGNLKETLSDKAVKDEIDKLSAAVVEKDLLEPDEKVRDITDLTRMLVQRQSFINDYNEIKAFPEQYKEPEKKSYEPQDLAEQKQKEGAEEQLEGKVRIKTKTGEKDYELNIPYFVGKGVDYKKDGLNSPVTISSMTILGQNNDGTIKIRDNKGVERDISKDVLEEYSLEKESELRSNKTANYFFNHRNEVFEFNFGKNFGGRKPGRLEYKNGKLFFVYFDNNNKLKRKELKKSHFVAQKGYDEARIKRVGVIQTAEQKQSEEEFKSAEELENERRTETLAKNKSKRIKIINELETEARARLDEVDKKLDAKRKQLESIQDELKAIEEVTAPPPRTKREGRLEQKRPEILGNKVRFGKVMATTSRAMSRLSKMREDVENEISQLTAEKDELEFNLSYFQDFIDNLDELPENRGEFLNELKSQIKWIDDLVRETGKNINSLSEIMMGIEKTLKNLASLLKSSLSKFDADYPEYMRDTLSEIQGGNFVIKNFADLKEYLADYAIVKNLQDEVSVNEGQLNQVSLEVSSLYEKIDELGKQYQAKRAILDKFQEVSDAYDAMVAEEERLAENERLKEELLGTQDKSIQTVDFDESQEEADKKSYKEFDTKFREDARKATPILPRATMGVVRGKAHQIRANLFGYYLNRFENKNNIRGVYVTSKTEEKLGLQGLTDRLRMDEQGQIDQSINKNEIIALVMVQQVGDELKLLGVDGKPIPEDVNKLDNAIYQVYPDNELRWTSQFGSETMFRAGTAENIVEAVTEQYKAWRKSILEKTDLEQPHKIAASFGFPIKVMDSEGNIDYQTMTSVEDADLITTGQLETDQLITIPTLVSKAPNLAVVNKDTTSITVPVGTPLLELPNGIVKLRNRKHTKKESEVIYQAIVQLAKYMLDPQVGMNDAKSKRLLTWLRSVVYWGIPTDQEGNRKPAGYNSVFFEKDETTGKLMLTLSGKGKDFRFTPSALEMEKETILLMLDNMYNNINNNMVKNINEPYEEVLSISENGEITSRLWKNYQSYLLSSKNPDGTKRSNEELPLSTLMKPVTNPNEVNRTAIYFFTTDTVDDYVIPAPQKKAVVTPAVLRPAGAPPMEAVVIGSAPAAPTAQAPTAAPPKEYVLDNNTINEYVSPTSGILIRFKASQNATPDNLLQEITFFHGYTDKEKQDIDNLMKRISDAGKDPRLEIRKVLFNEIAPTIDKLKSQANIADEIVVVGGAPAAPAPVVKQEEKPQEAPPAPVTVTPDVEDMFAPVTIVQPDPQKPLSQDVLNAIASASSGLSVQDEEVLREMIDRETKPFEPENWDRVEKWLKVNFPNVPVYRVKNVIRATNGRQAWGMFKDGAIYVYENAEVGTVYHEVFHGVWRMFTDTNEQASILSEMRARKGKFFDRTSLSDIKYSEATDRQLEEKLAEEFRDYVQFKKIPAKPEKGRPFILKLFSDLATFIRRMFLGREAASNVEKMFKRIDEGNYKSHIPYETSLSFAKQGIIDVEDVFASSDSVFSLTGITDKQRSEIIQELTYQTFLDITRTDKSLFEIEKINKKQLYADLKNKLLVTIAGKIATANKQVDDQTKTKEEVAPVIASTLQLLQNVDEQWDMIVEKHQEYLKGYSIEFDENDNINLKDENNSGRSDYQDASKIDNFKKASSAIKMLLSTVPRVLPNDRGGVKFDLSEIGGRMLVPTGEVYITMMNNLHEASDLEDMIRRFRELAETDIKYRAVYERVTKTDWSKEGVDLSNVNTEHGLQLLSSFWRTFKKQNPQVKNVFILENGEIVVGEANLASAAQQIKREYVNAIITKARSNEGYFKYDASKNKFVGDPTKVARENLGDIPSMLKFLKKLGIVFTEADVRKMGDNRRKFEESVLGIRTSIERSDEIATFSGKVLKMDGRLTELALIRASLDNPEFASTYFNIAGERTQTFIGTNAASDLADFFKNIKSFDDVNVIGTRYTYLKTDSFAKFSNLLARKFGSDGKMKKGAEDLFTVGYVGGLDNKPKGKKKESSKLRYKERLVQELNLNLEGWYLNLVPGDASIEHMIKMGNPISEESLNRGMTDVEEIFKGYFIAEFNLARENRRIEGVKGRKSTDLRFFKGILGEQLHEKIVRLVESSNITAEQAYENPSIKREINEKLKEFVEKDVRKLKTVLFQYGILDSTPTGIQMENINVPQDMDEKQLNTRLTMLSVNYMIANIELHKLLYSDPYQYADELKRIKNFNSPRQAIIYGSKEMNQALNAVWNKGYEKGGIGHTIFTRDYFRSATHADVIGVINLPGYEEFKETDGGGIIGMKSYRNFRIRAGEWNNDEERQYRYDIAWEKRDKGMELSKEEQDLLKKGNLGIKSAYTPIKPIVSGAKLDENGNPNTINEVMLDKFALYPVSYRIAKEIEKESNLLNLYNKMQNEDIDYIVFKSARKVGAKELHNTYTPEGGFNNTPYDTKNNVINVPFSIISIQAEVPSKEDNLVTRGSQVTKLVTLDYMEAGVPIDFFTSAPFPNRYKAWNRMTEDEKLAYNDGKNLYKDIKENQDLLKALIDYGYKSTLERMGISETSTVDEFGIVTKSFVVSDTSKAGQTLREEILKRETNDNVSDALKSFLNGSAVLEATPAYQQVRNILYSIADKEFISPKISGGMKVQIPSTLLEKERVALTEINGKKGYTSDVLKFYEEDGKRVAEVMVGRWFDSPLSDEELLKYLNETEEGQKILAGIAFRIPTQKQNSIDAIVIKKFLPKEFGDSVVIPAALVQKAGSDFDIDKLSMYLKNIYIKDGKPVLVPYFGTSEEALKKFEELYDKGEFLNDEQRTQLERFIEEEQLLLQDVAEDSPEGKLMSSIFGSLFSEEELTIEFTRGIPAKTQIINKLYKKSLENQYIQNMENLVTHPLNYNRLIKPNSAELLKELASKIAEKTAGGSFDYTKVDNMLDRTFMSRLRHAFVTGKYAIGIAAVNQTNHSLNQRQPIYVDKDRLSLVSPEDAFWLGDAEVRFPVFNTIEVNGKMVPTLSMIENRAKETISDIIGMFIDGYVDISKGPWIMELGATPNVASTWLFLVKIGVPINTVAYFMNQPIIRDYLRKIDSAGYSWLFIDSFVDEMAENYEVTLTEQEYQRMSNSFVIPSQTILENNLSKDVSDMNATERNNQYMILREFLKYAKMAEHMFHVTQGSNYDTATFNDGYLVFKKQMQYEKAKNSIISSVDDLLKNSFIGTLASYITDIRDGFSQILMSDKPKIRNVIQNILLPYVDMNDRDFVKLAQKAVNNLFDWAVQNDQGLNEMIQDILINDGGVGKEVQMFLEEVRTTVNHPLKNNDVIRVIESSPSMRAGRGGVNNVELKMKDNKVYDQNNIIYSFRELRDYLKDRNNPLYERLKTLAVLQSGLSGSKISFTSLIPYEDFEAIYNKTLSKIESMNLDTFYSLGVFQRNNWDDDDIVPYTAARLIYDKYGEPIYNPAMRFLPGPVKDAVSLNQIPPVMTISPRNREASHDFIVFTWDKSNEEILAMRTEEEVRMNMSVKQKKAKMKKIGDTSYRNRGLFRKVYDPQSKSPFTYVSNTGKDYFVYKAINAWGDGYRANEFWTTDHKSVIDNDFIKVEDVDDASIISKFSLKQRKKDEVSSSSPVAEVIGPETKINIYAGTGENADLSNLAVRPFTYLPSRGSFAEINFNSVEQAYQSLKGGTFDKATYDSSKFTPFNRNGIQTVSKEKGPSGTTTDEQKIELMKELILESFKQNPQALERLLATGNATLTHTQDKGKWETEFPRLLMEVREELKSQPIVFSQEKQKRLDELEVKIRSATGLTPDEAGEIDRLRAEKGREIKSNC